MSDRVDKEIEDYSPIWEDDINVRAAFQAGRDPDEILLIDCPSCGRPSYYNDGSHFTCRFDDCGAGYYVAAENELGPGLIDRPYVMADGAYTVQDAISADCEKERTR